MSNPHPAKPFFHAKLLALRSNWYDATNSQDPNFFMEPRPAPPDISSLSGRSVCHGSADPDVGWRALGLAVDDAKPLSEKALRRLIASHEPKPPTPTFTCWFCDTSVPQNPRGRHTRFCCKAHQILWHAREELKRQGKIV